MSKSFKVDMYYYDTRKLYKHNEISLEDGVTVLVGCNGSGKSTLLHIIRDELKKKRIPCKLYDNVKEGGHNAISSAFFHNDMSLGVGLMCASEGESISLNIMSITDEISEFILEGKEERNIFDGLFEKERKKPKTKERWLLFDAVDSGYSVDQVRDLKEMVLHNIIEAAGNSGYKVNIVISSNEYELCIGERCFDVIEGKYVDINTYEDYAKVIMKSRKYKDKSNDSYNKKLEKKEKKEKEQKVQEDQDDWRPRWRTRK